MYKVMYQVKLSFWARSRLFFVKLTRLSRRELSFTDWSVSESHKVSTINWTRIKNEIKNLAVVFKRCLVLEIKKTPKTIASRFSGKKKPNLIIIAVCILTFKNIFCVWNWKRHQLFHFVRATRIVKTNFCV